MALLDVQRRLAEIGRIRIGEQIPIGKSGKTRPAKLETFRLTSPNKTLIDAAANLYGGTPQPWQAPAGPQWEVITETAALPVIVPPGDVGFSQHYELWSGGGCLRRCDSNYATFIQDGAMTEGECLCDPEGRECKPHTRLSVMLRDLAGIGLWRLDTQGFYAAAELKGAVEILHQTRNLGILIPARLSLRQEVIKRPGQQTRRFAVPWLDVEITPGELAAGITTPPPADTAPPRAIDATARFTPVPTEDTTPEDIPTIAEQAAARTPRRSGGQAPIPRTRITPRTTNPQDSAPAGAEQSTAATLIPTPGRRRPTGDTIEALQGQLIEDARRKPSKRAPRTIQDLAHTPPEDAAAILADERREAAEAHDYPDEPFTPPQSRKMHAQFGVLDVTERDDRLAITSHILGYPITTSVGLTKSEANLLIDTLEDWMTDNDPPPGDRIREILNEAALRETEQEPDQ